MAFRLVSGAGNVNDPAAINMFGSGTIHPGGVVEFVRTSGIPLSPGTSSTTSTLIFGVAYSYAQGKSDTEIRVIPITVDQLWEADCANAGSTAQVGLRHALNTDTDIRNNATDTTGFTAVFEALYMVGSTSGSGKLVGRFLRSSAPVPVNSTTFL